MSVHDAQPSDIYVDANGKLWRCIMTCSEPTVSFEEVEGHVPHPLSNQMVQVAMPFPPPDPQIVKTRQTGAVNGLMFGGWKRIWRKEPG